MMAWQRGEDWSEVGRLSADGNLHSAVGCQGVDRTQDNFGRALFTFDYITEKMKIRYGIIYVVS
jgi:hypothetical protein